MNTTFIINGGAGRTLCSIPALEKFHKLNPDNNFNVIVHGWDMLFWSHPILQNRVFNASQKGLFEAIIKPNNIVMPEPYHVHNFFNEKISLIEAFDACINNTSDHSDLKKDGYLFLTRYEILGARQFIAEEKRKQNKKYCVMTQPYGSGIDIINGVLHDDTSRSIEEKNYYEIVNFLKNDCVVLYGSSEQFKRNNDSVTVSFEGAHPQLPYFRLMIALMSECDYFIGCDSVGQHMARALKKPGLVLMGPTKEKCFSYPDYFKIYRNNVRTPDYFPWRLAEVDAMFAARSNDGMMYFNDQQIEEIKNIIDSDFFKQQQPLSNNLFNYV